MNKVSTEIIKRIIFLISFLFITPLFFPVTAQAEVFYKAKVENVLSQGEITEYGITSPYQKLSIKILDGDIRGQLINIDHGVGFNLDQSQLVRVGDTVLMSKSYNIDNSVSYQIVDQYRLDKIGFIILFFFLAVLALSGWKGLGSIAGMVLSLAVIIKYIVPQILAGKDPLTVSIVGSVVIMITTIYLAHGFSKKTTVALISTFITLVATGFLSMFFVKIANLTGLGSEDAYSLKLGPTANINFQGLLLGGILIGALGVLDDVTTGLSASIFELAKANNKYKFKDLVKSGLEIGKEHIASLVNTLVLAYAGASLPIFIILVLNPGGYPLNVMLNDGLIMEEAVRTLAGSIGLIMAVPLTTILAAYYVSRHD